MGANQNFSNKNIQLSSHIKNQAVENRIYPFLFFVFILVDIFREINDKFPPLCA